MLKRSNLIKKMFPNIIFDFIVFLFDIGGQFGDKIHLASKNHVVPHNLFNDSPLYSFV